MKSGSFGWQPAGGKRLISERMAAAYHLLALNGRDIGQRRSGHRSVENMQSAAACGQRRAAALAAAASRGSGGALGAASAAAQRRTINGGSGNQWLMAQ